MRKAIASWGPDVVHVQFAISAFGTRTAALMRWLTSVHHDLGIPVVVTLHEVNREYAILGSFAYSIHRSVIKRSDHMILHSDKIYSRLQSWMSTSVPSLTVIPHPTGRPAASISSEQELRTRFDLGTSRILLAFGFIHIDKGLEDLVSALDIIHRETPGTLSNCRLAIAGDVRPRHGLFRVFEIRDWIYRAKLVRQIGRAGLRNSIVLSGYVPPGEVAAWFSLAEAVVLPYRRAEQSGVENLARSYSLPILSSTAGGLGKHTSESHWVFPPRAPKRIAETITEFLSAEPSGKGRHSNTSDSTDLHLVAANTLSLYAAVRNSANLGDTRAAHT